MPIYCYQHPRTKKVYEVLRPFSQSNDPFFAPDGKECCKVMTAPNVVIGEDKPDRYERKEKEHQKKVKDPERARKLRKAKFGTEGISITKSPYYKKEKRVKAQGGSDVSKKDFIQNAARNPHALAAAKKALKKG